MDKRKTGIVILGHPRSGTTLLRRLLDGHTRIACPPETHILSACARFLDAQATDHGVDMGVLSGLNFAGFPDESTLSELRSFAFSFLERYAQQQQKPRWAEKTAFDAFHIEEIDRLCGGHALFICVTRHPLDVAISTKEFCDSMGTYPHVLHEYIKQHPQPIRAFAHSWLDVAMQAEALRTRHPHQSIMVRYEDLVAAPEATVKTLLEFLGEEYEPEMLNHSLSSPGKIGFGDHKSYSGADIHGASVERWRALPDAQVASLADDLNPMLDRLGYAQLSAGSKVNIANAREGYRRNLDILSKRGLPPSSHNAVTPAAETHPGPAPFTVYGQSNRTRSDSTFLLQARLQQEVSEKLSCGKKTLPAQLTAALLGLLQRVSENEDLIAAVSINSAAENDVTRLLPIEVLNTPDNSFATVIEAVESKLDAQMNLSSDNTAAEVDFVVGHSPAKSDNETARALYLAYNDNDPSSLTFSFNQGLWTEASASRFIEHYLTLLSSMLDNPDEDIDSVYLLTANEEKTLFPSMQAIPKAMPRTDEAFFIQEKQHPDKVALVFEQDSLTYRQLGDRVRSLAGFLQARGIGPDAIVAICLHRSLDLVTSMLAVMHAGATYVPLDPDYPASRIDQIVEDANPVLVLTTGDLDAKFGESTAGKLVFLDAVDWQSFGNTFATPENEPDLAYVIFTSGSTGRPKGVQVRHHGLSTFLYAMSQEPGLNEDDRLLSVTTVSFDIAALELFLPLTVGATLYLATRKDITDGNALRHLLNKHKITVFQATPATYQLLLNAQWENTNDTKLLCGGEALPAELAAKLLDQSSELWNMYGPTETTIWSTVKRVTSAQSPMPIGRAIHGTSTYTLNTHRSPVPIGVPGELYISGAGVAQGYLDRPELTAENFVVDPFSNEAGARMYRTGDQVRVSEEGELFCLGRLDRQVKIRGFRIELGEIEVSISEIDNVRQCVVEAFSPEVGPKRLVAYLVLQDPGKPVGVDVVANALSSRLPEYMIPNAVVTMDALPLTPNNKIDRKALPAPVAENYSAIAQKTPSPEGDNKAPSSDLEKAIVDSWGKYFDPRMVSPESTFVSLGGDSLTYVQATMDLEDILGVVPDGWEHLSVSSLAQQKAEKSTYFAEVENSTFLRAIAIVFITFNHAALYAAAPLITFAGWTNALFMVIGFLLAKFQTPMVIAKDSPRPIVSSIIKILIPATIVTVAIQAYNNEFQLDELLLYSNLFRQTSSYWFIQVLIQFLSVVALVFCLGTVRRFVANRPFDFGLILLAIAGLLLLSAPFVTIPDERILQLPQFRFWQFAIGWCIYFSDTHARRVSIAYTLCVFAVADYFLVDYVLFGINFSLHNSLVSVAAGLILLFVPRITLVKPLHHLSYPMAGASLFILLTHMEVLEISRELGFDKMIAMNVFVCLLVGYLCWRGWDFVLRRFNRRNYEEPI